MLTKILSSNDWSAVSCFNLNDMSKVQEKQLRKNKPAKHGVFSNIN